MLKSVIALLTLIALSILIILFMPYAQQVLEWLSSAHNWVAEVLTQVFSGGQAGDLTRKLLSLLAIPFFIGLIPVITFWLIKRSMLPYFMQIVWVTWLIQTAVLIIQFKAGA